MFETVYTLTDWYDGPRRGVAAFHGQPHVFESRWSDIGREEADTFLLMPISAETLELALEDWAIWIRWQTAFREGRTSQRTHPSLPEDAARHAELKDELRRRLAVDEARAVCATATFRRDGQHPESLAWGGYEVEWTQVPCDAGADRRSEFDL